MAATDLQKAWLRDAHGMEKAIADFNDRILKRFEGHDEIVSVLSDIKDESQQHLKDVEGLLASEDESKSTGKDIFAEVTSFISGVGSHLFGDDQVKDLLALHGVLHFAHACYISLTATAQFNADDAVAEITERLAEEKQDLADRVLEIVPIATVDALENAK